jgi:transcriptional regulator NrdR family protein
MCIVCDARFTTYEVIASRNAVAVPALKKLRASLLDTQDDLAIIIERLGALIALQDAEAMVARIKSKGDQ